MISAGDDVGVGFDLGTSRSRAAICRNGIVGIVPTRNGDRSRPSTVILPSSNNPLALGPTHNESDGISSLLRFFGRRFDDPQLKSAYQFTAVEVIPSSCNTISVRVGGQEHSIESLFS